MNLRTIANRCTKTVNANERITIKRSAGFGVGSGARQIPLYEDGVCGIAQIQALDGNDLKQLDGLNIQGVLRAVYLTGELSAVIRPNQVGGDIIERGKETWLIVKILEHWTDWTKAVICLQEDVAQ